MHAVTSAEVVGAIQNMISEQADPAKSGQRCFHARIWKSYAGMTVTDAPRIRTEVQVMFFDTDCGGVVHNIAYLRFIEIARTLLAEQLGLALSDMAATQKYPVVVRTEIDYRRAAKLGDRLTIEGWLDHLERVRFWCAVQLCGTRTMP